MGAVPFRNANAPSAALLKFLRAQKDGRSFFTQNRELVARCSWPRAAASTARPCRKIVRMGFRNMATCCSMPYLPLQSSIFPLEAFWPRTKPSIPSGHGPETVATQGTRIAVSFFNSAASFEVASRSASTTSEDRSYRRFWGFRKQQKESPLQPNDLPPISNFLDDNANLGRIARHGNELKLRCTEFDANGNVTLVNGEFKKTELIAKYGLLPRDLRKIDSSILPHILVRPSAILINLLHLRCLIKHDRVLVFDAYGSTDSYTQSLFMYDLEGKLRAAPAAKDKSSQLPYEFRALEAVLISVTSGLEGEFEGVRGPVVRVLRDLEEDIDREKLRHLLIYSKKLGSFEQKARLVRDAIDDLLEADDDLAAMYLSEKAAGKEREDADHTEVEMLLESYHKVCDELVQVSGNLVTNIRTTEEVIRAILDANRNQLMLLDLKFSIGTLGLGGGTFVAALYGMNLKNFMEESDYGFWGVSAWCTIFSIFVLMWGMRKLRSTERLSMWGTKGGGKRGWASLGERPSEPILKQARMERIRAARDDYLQHDVRPVEALPPVPTAYRKSGK